MNGYLELRPEGLFQFRWDSDFRSECKIKKKNGQWEVIRRNTKEVIHVADSAEAAEKIFWQEKRDEIFWNHLPNIVEVSSPVTLSQVQEAIYSHESLDAVISMFWPVVGNREVEEFEKLVLSRRLIVTGDLVEMKYYINGHRFDEVVCLKSLPITDAVVEIDEEIPIIVNGVEIQRGSCRFTLMELLTALYGRTVDPTPVILQAGGLYEENGEPVENLFAALVRPCWVKETTLENIMRLVQSSDLLTSFISMYSWCSSIEDFHRELDFHPNLDDEEKLDYLEISRISVIEKFQSEEGWWVAIHEDFHGVGKPNLEQWTAIVEVETDPTYGVEKYGVEFTPVQQIKHLPVKIDTQAKIKRNSFDKGRLSSTILAQGTWVYSLLDILNAIYYEVSFVGSPEERDDFREELKDRIESLDENSYKNFKDLLDESSSDA